MSDVNAPLTVWRPTNGNGEAINPGTDFIVDTIGVFLVDTVGSNVVDTGTDFVTTPLSIWGQNDGN